VISEEDTFVLRVGMLISATISRHHAGDGESGFKLSPALWSATRTIGPDRHERRAMNIPAQRKSVAARITLIRIIADGDLVRVGDDPRHRDEGDEQRRDAEPATKTPARSRASASSLSQLLPISPMGLISMST
jgi:hypothetical protein